MHNLGSAVSDRPSKVIMLGESCVGKTSIVLQFYKSEFDTMSEPTIGAAYVMKEMQTKKGPVLMHIWDTAGQERFKSVIPMYMRGCSAAILVCAADSKESVPALNNWLKLVRETVANLQLIFVVLNKTDLQVEVDAGAAEKWALDHGFKFFRTSAMDKSTIDPLFQEVAESLTARAMCTDVPIPPEAPKKGAGCCG
jgi:small GTP-binding protein